MSKSGPQIGTFYPSNKSPDCLALCDRFTHDFGCPAVKRVYSLSEIEQNFNIRSTTLGSTSDFDHYRRPPGTPFRTSTPDFVKTDFKLDSRLLHEAITRSCTGFQGGLHPDTVSEQAEAAVILMGMNSRGCAPYTPTMADIRYHELCCGGVLAPGASREEIMADMELLRQAIDKDKKAKSIFSSVKRNGERTVSALGFADGRMQQKSSGWMGRGPNMRGSN